MLWYTYFYENTWDTALFGKGNAWVAGEVKGRVALIKVLFTREFGRSIWGRAMKDLPK